MLKLSQFNTKIGEVLALADECYLYLLEFIDYRLINTEIKQVEEHLKFKVINGDSKITRLIKTELDLYFNGDLLEFKTPAKSIGSEFQKLVWNNLINIPYGSTIGYSDFAKSINKLTAFRAVANANGANKMSIIIPCHRVINSSGSLGGYAGGLWRKKWLLEHESKMLDFKPMSMYN